MIQCMAPNKDLCTASEVAQMYGTSADTVRRWARDGKLPVVTLPSGRMKFRRADVDALIAGTQRASA